MPSGWDTDDLSDHVRRAKNGDDDAFGALYHAVAPRARRTAYRLVKDAHVADDIVQEAFYIVLRSLRSGRGPDGPFAGYVLLITKRLAYQHRALARRTVPLEDTQAWQAAGTGTSWPSSPDAAAVEALASLPARWRGVLWLIEVDRYSPAELAAPMRMTPSAVSSLATRARRALRSAYAAAG